MLARVIRILREGGAGGLASRSLGFAYRRLRPLLPADGPARLGGVLSCYDRTRADRCVPRAWLPWWMTDPDGDSRYEAALVSGLDAHVRPGDRVVVVGGGIGVTAVKAALRAAPSGRVDCFEGSLENCALVRRTAALNAVDNLTVHHAVVGASLAVYGPASGAGRVLPAGQLPPCDVLELDCEGAEVRILREMAIRPRVLLVETHGVHGAPTSLVAAAMAALGYAVSDRGWAEPSQLATCIRDDIRVLLGLRADPEDPAPTPSGR